MNDFFPSAEPTIEAQINEIRREIGMRVSVYARRVADGKMSQRAADNQIELMQAVERSLIRLQNIIPSGQ